MKVKFEFDHEDVYDREKLETMLKASKIEVALEEIWQQCFRPNYKHGYNDDIFKTLTKRQGNLIHKVIDCLAEKYQEIIKNIEE